MKKENQQYQLANLYLLNRSNLVANKKIEKQLIEKCNSYINKYRSIVEKLAPSDFSEKIDANELDEYLENLEKVILNYLDSENYNRLCEAMTNLNRWEILKSKLESSSS